MPEDLTPEQIAANEKAAAEAKAKADAEALEREKSNKNITDREAELLKEVMAKKEAVKNATAAAEAAKKEAEDLAARLKAYDGIDLEEIKGLLKEKQDREQAELEKRGEFERVKEQIIAAHKQEIETVRGELAPKLEALTGEVAKRDQVITELTIGRSFSESPFIRDSLALPVSKARILYGSHFELTDGKVVAYDKPAGSANRTPLVDGNGEPLSFDKAIEKIVDSDPDRDNLLKSKIRSGAGSDNDHGIDTADKKKKPLSGMERILAGIKENGMPELKVV